MQELPKEVMQAMEMENYANVEVPASNNEEDRFASKGESTILQD